MEQAVFFDFICEDLILGVQKGVIDSIPFF